MTIKAKEILNGRFWIVEDCGERIGTLSKNEDKYIFTNPREVKFFDSARQVKKSFGNEMKWEPVVAAHENKTDSVYGYPTSVTPYNIMYDITKKLPLFTKSKKSKSLYCAGYYIIKFNKGWVKSFCPKLITVERYETKGPFKTSIEMKQELLHAE